MHKLRHPLSGGIYEDVGDRKIRVEKDGRSGTFTSNGVWLEGELTTADPEMCRWIASQQELLMRQGGPVARDRAQAYKELDVAAILDAAKGVS